MHTEAFLEKNYPCPHRSRSPGKWCTTLRWVELVRVASCGDGSVPV